MKVNYQERITSVLFQLDSIFKRDSPKKKARRRLLRFSPDKLRKSSKHYVNKLFYRVPEVVVPPIGEIDAYEVKSQTTEYDGKVSHWQYSGEGIFENEPKPEKIETMIGNSLVAAFNNPVVKPIVKGKKKYIQKDLFGQLVNDGIRGIEIRKVKVPKSRITNQMRVKLRIKNKKTHYSWEGEN